MMKSECHKEGVKALFPMLTKKRLAYKDPFHASLLTLAGKAGCPATGMKLEDERRIETFHRTTTRGVIVKNPIPQLNTLAYIR